MADHSHKEGAKVTQPAPQQRWNGATLPLTPAGIQRKELRDAIQQKKAAEMANFYGGTIQSPVQTIQRKLSSNPNGLPESVQGKMETAMGADFSSVQVHQNSSQAKDLGALAYTQGENIHFAPGQFDAQSQQGQSLIGHELAHVVQQREGRVQPTTQAKGLAVNDDAGLEKEADEKGAMAAQMKAVDGDTGGRAIVGTLARHAIQKADDPRIPQLEPFKGAEVNQPGKISAPAKEYATAKDVGVNVRAKPDHTLAAIGKLRYNTTVHVIAEDNCNGYYFVAGGAVNGWVNKNFVALGMPDYLADLHHVTENNLTTILKQHYIDGGRWTLSTGNDYTTLAAAVLAANDGRKGVSVDWKKAQAYKDEHWIRGGLDPWMIDNFAIYDASSLVMGTNIWLPPAGYIKMLQATGTIGSRPDWMNAVIGAGKAISGFTIGVYAGIYGDLWDMLVGLWESAKAIIGTIRSVLDGSIFQNIKDIYDQIKGMTMAKALEMAQSVINMGKAAIGDFVANWEHGDEYKRWYFRGKIVGTIVTEVVLAVCTFGESLAVQVIAKLGKYFPKLAAVLGKVLKVADKLDFGGGKKKPDLPDAPHKPHGMDGPDKPNPKAKPEFDPEDKEARDWYVRLSIATGITEMHDQIDTPVKVLIPLLNNSVARGSEAVHGYKAMPLAEPGHYQIVQFAKRKEVDGDYSEGKEQKSDSSPQNRAPKSITSRVKEDSQLLKYAEETFEGNDRIRNEVNQLISQMKSGNFSGGIGSHGIGDSIFELRGSNGGRVYFRNVGDAVEILGYSGKGNQQKVIDRIRYLYGK